MNKYKVTKPDGTAFLVKTGAKIAEVRREYCYTDGKPNKNKVERI